MTTKYQAYRIVRSAIKNGVLIRPEKCARCGVIPRRGTDGRSMIHGHHADYNIPLDVEWICAWCHRKETPKPRPRGAHPEQAGEFNGNAKLTFEQAAEIRESNMSHRKLGRLYGVAHAQIGRIKRGKAYAAAPQEGGK